jgi:HK97 family phage portal protein
MLLKAIRNYLTPQSAPEGKNLLNEIVYPYFNSAGILVWYDGTNQTFVDEGYRGNALIYSIIRKIADKSKTCPVAVFKNSSRERKYQSAKYSRKDLNRAQASIYRTKELVEVPESDPVVRLLQKPNPMQTWSELLNDISTWFNTSGEVFIYGFAPSEGLNKGKFKELYVLPANYVELVMGGMLEPVRDYKLAIGNQTIEIPASDVLHIKQPNLSWDLNGKQLRGMSPLLPGLKTMQGNAYSVEAKTNAYLNQGAKGILSPNVQNPEFWPTPEQRQMIDQRVDERINGNANINRVIASSLPLRYDAIGLSPLALDIINSQNMDLQTLCGLWGVNPVLFQSNATYSNVEHAQKALVTDVVMPQLQLFEEKLTEWIGSRYGMDYVVDFDTSAYAELQPDVKLIFDTYGKSPAITFNELRTMVGFDVSEAEGMNNHWVNQGLIPMDEALGGQATDFVDFQE